MLYRIVTEYLFLTQENFEYSENLKYIFEYFSINKQSKNSIRGNIENIYKAVGADGLIEFYGYLSAEVTIDDIESIAENTVDLENDSAERFEEIDIADDKEPNAENTVDLENDSAKRLEEVDFVDTVAALFSNSRNFSKEIKSNRTKSTVINSALGALSKIEADNHNHQQR